MSFFNVRGKTFLITGVANAKSVATSVAKSLKSEGAEIILSVQNEAFVEKVKRLFPEEAILCCDVSKEEEIFALGESVAKMGKELSGMLHSLAFARLTPGQSFHETSYRDLEEASRISCFSLSKLAHALKSSFARDASVVTISISSTKATAYGFLGPIKAMLDATVPYLAKAFSAHSEVRFNAVCAGPLKTSASAGIPGYLENYLYAEKLTLRGRALLTQEVANVACFLLAPCSSGINGERIVVDAGMECNYFDQKIVKASL
ncbi:MAG: SDR family oxidoreductase [Oligoflexia bacterium]|nr:SDR family oxidoreductase [Oligoflexia bacterium]MBF0364974.1 SDR family oxidoreductase [Oligoflexia bacterium]